MLNVIIREAKVLQHTLLRPIALYNRQKNFPVNELRGINLVKKDTKGSVFWFNRNDLDLYQNSSQVLNFIDVNKSKGNYVVDADGNTMLDVNQTELNPLGYNHKSFQQLVGSSELDAAVINGSQLDSLSDKNAFKLVKNTLLQNAPNGLNGFTLVNSQNAVGAAVKDAFIARGLEQGQSALYFSGSSHGSPLTLGGMICGWPKLEYPSSHSHESQVLEKCRALLKEKWNSDNKISAIVLEPTQYSTGYKVSEEFIVGLRQISNDFEAALILDETSTGCGASGNGFWQNESTIADYVAFGKRTQVTGYYSKNQSINLGGNLNDVKLFQNIQKTINDEQLLKKVSETSKNVAQKSENLQKVEGITGARTSGTSVWVNTDSEQTTQKLVEHLRQSGILVQKNGSKGIVARPALIFGDQQVSELFDAIVAFRK